MSAEADEMTSQSQNHDIAGMRKLLTASFDDAELDAFTQGRYLEVYEKLGRGMRKDEKITMLLDHCRRQEGGLEQLAAAVQGWSSSARILPRKRLQGWHKVAIAVLLIAVVAVILWALLGQQPTAYMEIVLDNGPVPPQHQLNDLKVVLQKELGRALPDAALALRVFGLRCGDTQRVVDFSTGNATEVAGALEDVYGVGQADLTEAIRQSINDLLERKGDQPRVVVVVTWGREGCGGDLEEALAGYREQLGTRVALYILNRGTEVVSISQSGVYAVKATNDAQLGATISKINTALEAGIWPSTPADLVTPTPTKTPIPLPLKTRVPIPIVTVRPAPTGLLVPTAIVTPVPFVAEFYPVELGVFAASDQAGLAKQATSFVEFYTGTAKITTESVSPGSDDQVGYKITYDRINLTSFACWEFVLTPTDVSALPYLTFDIKGEKGGERPNIWLRSSGQASHVRNYVDLEKYVKVSTKWQRARISLADLRQQDGGKRNIDLAQITEVDLCFEWEDMAGTVFVDAFAFERR